MSEPELDAAVLKATQESLGKFVKKPPLTEKLLKKPPFRYLMDVFNSFIKQTGCFEGLYTPQEQLFENIGVRHDKIRFLQKMIDVTKLTTKRDLKVRTSKIVAGHEAHLTNELLQAMASVAEQQLEWRSAVQQVLAAEAKESTESKEARPKETRAREAKATSKQISPRGKEEAALRREKRISPQEQKQQKRTTPPVKDKDKEKLQRRQKASPEAEAKPKLSKQSSKQKSPSPTKLGLKQKQQSSTEGEGKSAEPVAPAPVKQASPVSVPTPLPAPTPISPPKPEPVAEPPKQPTPELPPEPESRKSSSRSRRSSASQSRQAPAEVEPVESPPKTANDSSEPANPSPTADRNNNKREREGTFTRENSKESNGSITRPRTSLRPPSARPASARPGAPRRRNVEIVLQPNDQVKMSGINVKLETFGDFDDDGENLVIIEDANAHDIEAGSGATDAQPELADAQQGRLVQQILETQKELVQQPTEAGREEKSSNSATRQSSARQVNDLREIIQTLTKSVNPLGKLLDFIPEDIDAMQLELTMWRDTYTQSAMELKRELSLTASATEPMKQQLLSIEASIGEYKELIDESRHKILQNSERILKMLMEQ
ncbi:hypothetical protein KR222_010722 [Zaprionus bogoriensis]|nr:hypothetical protein KR222_010722 [Zaprionus bogoriensis]